MKVILLENIPKLGKKYDLKDVADGYATNFLIPKKLAVVATSAKIKEVENFKKKEEFKKEREKTIIEQLIQQLKNVKLKFIVRADKNGKIFGSVTKEDIIKKLKEQEGIELEQRQLILEEHIKKLGEYLIKIKFGPKLEIELKISVLTQN